jgi:hypothetical protein
LVSAIINNEIYGEESYSPFPIFPLRGKGQAFPHRVKREKGLVFIKQK